MGQNNIFVAFVSHRQYYQAEDRIYEILRQVEKQIPNNRRGSKNIKDATAQQLIELLNQVKKENTSGIRCDCHADFP